MFHKIYYDMSVVKLPDFLVGVTDQTYFQRQTRAFNDNDRLKLKCTINPRVNAFKNSYFYRAHVFWNSVPLEIREIESPDSFKARLEQYLWLIAESNLNSN